MHFNYTTWKQRTGGKWPRAVCRAGGKENWGWNSETAQPLVGKQGCGGWREQEKMLQRDTAAASAAVSERGWRSSCQFGGHGNTLQKKPSGAARAGFPWGWDEMEKEKVSLPCPPPVLPLGAGLPPSRGDWAAGATIFSDGYISEECPPPPRCWRETSWLILSGSLKEIKGAENKWATTGFLNQRIAVRKGNQGPESRRSLCKA